MSDKQYFLDKIAQIEAAIDAAITAESEILAGTISTYTLDTGQTRTVVQKHNLKTLRDHIDVLLNRRRIFREKAGLDSSVSYAGASW